MSTTCSRRAFTGLHRLTGIAALAAVCAVASPSMAADPAKQTPKATAKAAPDRAALEKQFAETMSGATMIGRFTTTGAKEDPKEEKYTLGPVKKLKGDFWSFETRIQYGDHDVKVPLSIEVLWAGDTPVISLTEMEIPGMGKFTARVLVYRDHYSGYWDAGDHGGTLFGRITHPETEKE
ncbi:MAG: hypothetical protein AB7O62_12310 [Pirellulales bacterium]